MCEVITSEVAKKMQAQGIRLDLFRAEGLELLGLTPDEAELAVFGHIRERRGGEGYLVAFMVRIEAEAALSGAGGEREVTG